jgi:hypothetical protein
MKELTLKVSEKGGFTITQVLPMFSFCIDTMNKEKLTYDESDDLYVCIDTAVDKLTHYYDQMSPIVGVALMLDPRKSKRDKYLKKLDWEDDWIKTSLDNFDYAFENYKNKYDKQNIRTISIIPMKRSNAHDDSFDKWEQNLNGGSSEVDEVEEDEKGKYFSENRNSGDIMTFWKYNQHKYPILSAMARDFLAVQASSVSSERAFSAGANLVSKRRCAMSGHTIELTQFLKYSFRSDRQ